MGYPSRQPRRTQPTGYDVNAQGAQSSKKLNENLRYTQGFYYSALAAGSNTPQTVKLNAPGKMLLGLTVIPLAASDISITLITLSVNNNNVILNTAAQNLNPSFVGNMIFFPAPQELFGNDTITLTINNQSGSAITVTVNFFYIPQ